MSLDANQVPPNTSSAAPTRIRFLIIGMVTSISVLLYLDRFCISFAETYIRQDLELSDAQVGWMLSAFFWTYALAQVPSGWLTDRFGARMMLTIYVVIWSLLTALTGAAASFGILLLLRLGFGVAQAGAYPTCAALLSRWVPLSSRGKASSVVALGGRMGGALAPMLTAWLIVAFIPLSHDSLFKAGDLLHQSRLQQRLKHAGSSLPTHATTTDANADRDPIDQWIGARLSPPTQRWVQSAPNAPAQATAPAAEVSQDQGEQIIRDFNALLQSSELAQLPYWNREALPREGKLLAERDAATLSGTERLRLNRLLIETHYGEIFRRLYVDGWRPVMLVYGFAGLPVALLFWLVFRNSPAEHPHCNAAEVAMMQFGKLKPDEPARGRLVSPIPIVALITSRSMWMNCISQFATNIGWVFLVTWLPRYLEHHHRVPIEQRAVMTLIPMMVGFAGMYLGGWWTDSLTRRLGLRWGRALPIGLSRLIGMAAYLLCLLHPSPWIAVALFACVAFATDLGVGGTWSYVQDVGGRHVGSVLGWGNMWGNFGAAVMPPVLVWVIGSERNWDAGFLACAAAFFVAALAGLGIDATKPIDQQQ